MSYKAFFIASLSFLLALLLVMGGVMVAVDPFFHYHAPLDNIDYKIHDQRYQNDGILRNFEYDSIIIGTSMTENFAASQWDELFNAKTVKVSLSGSYLKESADRLDRAFLSNNHIKYVVRSLDLYSLIVSKDSISDYDYPDYLYDDNIFNDVKYLFNKSVWSNEVLPVLYNTQHDIKITNFDEAYNWSDDFIYGKQSVLERYNRPEKVETTTAVIPDSMKQVIKENIEQNVIRLVKEHTQTEFYLFFPPYSIVSWDSWQRVGNLEYNIEVMRYVSKLLIGQENIYLLSLNDDFDKICNLDNYKDLEHYGEWINSEILEKMKKGEGFITEENCDTHYDSLLDFYSKYEYDKIFE